MVSGINKILRLSTANIKKHKLESAALALLVMLCMLLLGSSLGASIAIRSIFPQVVAHTQSYQNFILFLEKTYDPELQQILDRKEHVDESVTAQILGTMSGNYLDRQGKEQALYMFFMTKDENDKIQTTTIESTLSEAEIAAVEHPIVMPYTMHDSLGCQEGDSFDVVIGTKHFPFTVTGFYDTLIFDQVSSGVKMLVSEEDYHLLSAVVPPYVCLAYNDSYGAGGDDLLSDYINEAKEWSDQDIMSGIFAMDYGSIKLGIEMPGESVMAVMIAMSVIVILAVAVMIRFRIAGDIRDQIVNIGVLEALGYTSGQITGAYVLEYLLLAAVGVIVGLGGSFALTPIIFHAGELVSEHRGQVGIAVLPILLAAAAILAFVSLIAFLRARAVKDYPPVRAFRRGQGDHRRTKSRLPLRDTKGHVHLRLALKGFLENWRQSVGLTVCILVSAAAVVFSSVLFSFFAGNKNAIAATAGMEMSDLRVTLMPYVDAEAFAEEVAALPEVRKATPTCSELYFGVAGTGDTVLPNIFTSFDVTENIFPATGRFPEHDNEIMISVMGARHFHLGVGDTITIEYMKVEKPYLITGIVTSSTNGGANIYLTEEGAKRLIPTYRPNTVEIYLEDGADLPAFRSEFTARYGRSLSDAAKEQAAGGTLEDRIRAEAEQQIAEMLANYGTTHVEYAIQIGDQVITGDSSAFQIASIMNFNDILRTQLAGMAASISMIATLFMVLAAIVVMVIILVLMEATIRRQRKELGVMKSMGYTSRELMLQLAMRIMPAAVVAVTVGTVIGVSATRLLTAYVGRVPVRMPLVLVLDAAFLAFCFVCGYLGARKIKKISVYELMTE